MTTVIEAATDAAITSAIEAATVVLMAFCSLDEKGKYLRGILIAHAEKMARKQKYNE